MTLSKVKNNSPISCGVKNNVIAEHLKLPELLPPGRCVGKSTALALRTIAHCLQYPGTEVEIVDHVRSAKVNDYLAQMIGRYIQALGFVGFEIKKGHRGIYLVFNLYPSSNKETK